MSVIKTTALADEMMIYYQKVFLARKEGDQVHAEGAQKRAMGKATGKTIHFTRYTPLATVTAALTEGSNPSEVALTGAAVTAALAEYGSSIKLSRFLSLTSIDQNNKEKIEVLGQNMRETLDELVRNELFSGATEQLGNGAAALTDVAATDIFDVTEVRKAVRTLKANKALKYSGRGSFIGKVQPATSFDLMGDSAWVNAHTYKDGDNFYQGEIGMIHGVRFLETADGKVEASTVSVYSNFIHGKEAFGVYDLDGDNPRLFIVPNSSLDSGNPAGRFGLASWAGSYVVKTLQADWLLNVKTGVTA